MVKKKRIEILKEFIKKNKMVTLEECVELLKTSESTVRRDFEELESSGLLKRFHGGAEYISKNKDELDFTNKLIINKDDKEVIGKYAASKVDDGDCIFLDAGSTVYGMIPYLKDKNITVVTNGVTHISLLLEYDIPTSLVGGQIKTITSTILGEEAEQQLNKYYFDKAFLGINSISFENGFSTPDIREAVIKSIVVNRTRKPYFVADSNKFGQSSFAKVVELKECTVITDKLIEEFDKVMDIEVAK
ncbi:DeoR/GlpR family DNA-binding transcription regulator [Mycoplasmatota bacterium WC44]